MGNELKPTQLKEQEIANLGMDPDTNPNIPYRGMLYWTGTAWAKLGAGLVPSNYDYIALSYTGSNLTGVVFRKGGSGGTIVATLTLSYTGSQLDTIAKT